MLGPQQERFVNMALNQILSSQNDIIAQQNDSPLKLTKKSNEDQIKIITNSQALSSKKQNNASISNNLNEKQLEDDNFQMRIVIQKLNQKLREINQEVQQLKREKCERHGLPYEDPGILVLEEQMNFKSNIESDSDLLKLLPFHIIGPLIESYEQNCALLKREVLQTKLKFEQQMEVCKSILIENDELREQLLILNKDLLKVNKEKKDNINLEIDNESSPSKEQFIGENKNIPKQNQQLVDLMNRVHLLSEENQVLFQQTQVLRSHYDKFNKEQIEKTEEANQKINSFYKLQNDYQQISLQLESSLQTQKFLELQLTEANRKLGVFQESKKNQDQQIKAQSEQINLLKREYEFHKDLSEKLEFRQNDEFTHLNNNVRRMGELEKDYKQKLEILEQEYKECQHQNRQLISDIQRMQRDLKSIMAINEEYQLQAQLFKDREADYNELSREYREKLEAIKFDRERIALKEEQFLRLIQKAESQAKQDVNRHVERLEAQMHSKSREYARKMDEYEEKMSHTADELENFKRTSEKQQRENSDLQKKINLLIQKEDRTINQYEKLIDQLKNEIKDKERQYLTTETREAYQRQELNQKLKDSQTKFEEKIVEIKNKESQIQKYFSEIEVLKEQLNKIESRIYIR